MLKALASPVTANVLDWFHELSDWAADNGYWAISSIVAGDGVIPLFPGETAVVAGGNFASQGKLWLIGVILAGFFGAIIGDNIAFWLGRLGGDRITRWLTKVAGRDRVVAAERMIQERGPVLVAAGRFLPGIRLAINLSCGAGHLDYKRFVIFNALGASIWSAQAAILGYAFGRTFEDKPWLGLMIAIGIALVIGALVSAFEHRRVKHHRTQALVDAEAARTD